MKCSMLVIYKLWIWCCYDIQLILHVTKFGSLFWITLHMQAYVFSLYNTVQPEDDFIQAKTWSWIRCLINKCNHSRIFGEPGRGGSFTRDYERWMKEGSGYGASLSVGALWGEPGGKAPLLGTLKDMLMLWKCPSVSIGGPFWGTQWDIPFLGPSREGWNFYLSGELLWGTQETRKRWLRKRSISY